MSKAAITFALLVAALLSPRLHSRRVEATERVGENLGFLWLGRVERPGWETFGSDSGHGGASGAGGKSRGYTGHGGAGAAVGKPPGYTGHGGAGAAVGKPPGYTGHSGAGAGVGKPPGYTGHSGAGAGVGKPAVESQPKS